MSSYIREDLRQLVAKRAERLCEYCLIHEADIILRLRDRSHRQRETLRPTESANLAYACSFCNRNKGSDIASLSQVTGELARFFNPRIDLWSEHFRLEGSLIAPLTSIGEVTARILKFNESERVLERETFDYNRTISL